MVNNCPKIILLVDDDPAHRRLIKRAIDKSHLALEVVEAAGLSEARSLLFESTCSPQPLAAIIDLNLADGRGTDLIAELRASAAYSGLPIIVLSTSFLDEDINESYRTGADCYLTKSEDLSSFGKDIAGGIRFLLAMEYEEFR